VDNSKVDTSYMFDQTKSICRVQTQFLDLSDFFAYLFKYCMQSQLHNLISFVFYLLYAVVIQ